MYLQCPVQLGALHRKIAQMNSNDPRYNLYLGVDTHLELHVATLINELGQVAKNKAFNASISGYRELFTWCKPYGLLQKAGIENTGSYGAERLCCVIRWNQIRKLRSDRLHQLIIVALCRNLVTKQLTGNSTTKPLSTKEIAHNLKRYIARELFPLILKDLAKLASHRNVNAPMERLFRSLKTEWIPVTG